MTKREFLAGALATVATTLVWQPVFSLCRTIVARIGLRLDLNGRWQVSQKGKSEWIGATVPGSIFTDLMAAGKIPDPFYRDNEKAVQWVGESDWSYRRSFDVPEEVLKQDRVFLLCDGLDTLATLRINDTEVGRADNMFRRWEFDVKAHLLPGENVIEVGFESPSIVMRERDSNREPDKWVKGRAWVRKEPCSYGWDWGPVLPGCGIWKNISIETYNEARIRDVRVLQNHENGAVNLEVEIQTDRTDDQELRANISVLDGNRLMATQPADLPNGTGRAVLKVDHPRLWWPAGMGGQPLYSVNIDLVNSDGKTIDTASKRIGLRVLQCCRPDGDNPLRFEVNGIPFFAKGANWIPADSFPHRVTAEISRRYVSDAAAVNMNFLRFWGGGYYEDDALFDACDELGICVWLDFKFACSAYPAFDAAFMENVRLEARDNLRRLRHHPCIAVWCGNNEISLLNEGQGWSDNSMSRADYDRLFKDLLGRVVSDLAPDANYVSGSPDCGDTHYWDVWHGTKDFDAYRTLSGFMSEFGYQSFPEPKTIRAFTNEEDRTSVVSPVMKWHQRSGLGNIEGNQEMADMIQSYFKAPKDFESTLWLSQILQGYGIKTGAEYWRQTMPRSMGCIFWQYNDIWPGMSWSSVDYFGRWKALHYMARKFYAPLLISGLENPVNGTVDVFITNDLLESRSGRATWEVTDLAGNILSRDSMEVSIAARKSTKVKTVDLSGAIQKCGTAGILTWLKLESGHQLVSDNLVLLAPPKDLHLSDPRLSATVKKSRNQFHVTVHSRNPALWMWIGLEEDDARYSDNFIHVMPDKPQTIVVESLRELSREALVKSLRLRSLFDTSHPT